ncbi:MAG: acetoacetate--CoA ligase [Chitinophagaceae bacterium]|nr:acetoacetate--CoA ligase [Chitinophagaceae bacterium]
MKMDNTPLWSPPAGFIEQSNMQHFINWLKERKNLAFDNYEELWQWSVTDIAVFWTCISEYNKVQFHYVYEDVLVKPREGMIGTQWFKGATLNYAEHIFRNKTGKHPAIVFQSERQPLTEISWAQLEEQVSKAVVFLKQCGITKGDRVVSIMPNIPETVVAFLAAASVGAVWSSCSPDFGNQSVIDRFRQIEPKVLFATDGYTYNGKAFDKRTALQELVKSLPGLKQVVVFPFLDENAVVENTISWAEVMSATAQPLQFEPLPFEHPIWVLYSSGTTGKPKAITHSVGGCLLEHLKTLTLHQDVKPGEKYFWYSTTGWMMWNFSVASLLAGATLVIYEGSAAYPDLNVLWNLAEHAGINHFGGGAAYFIACMKAGLNFIDSNKLKALRTIGSTGSPLPPEAFKWIHESVKKEVWLISFSGGTDICSGFVGGCPLWPVYPGEIQCRLLGCKLEAFDDNGKPVREQLGEMVILEPMPSMPVYFWNDKNNELYRSSYFENYPNIWRHGDWIEITNRQSVIIFGRSDATLNRDGVRIGTSEIYSAVDQVAEISDSLVVCLELEGGKYFMPLFVVMKEGLKLNDEIKSKIKSQLRRQYSPRHVPDEIYGVNEIPYTISGKKMEAPVKKILMGMDASKAASKDTMKNPQALDYFARFKDSIPG